MMTNDHYNYNNDYNTRKRLASWAQQDQSFSLRSNDSAKAEIQTHIARNTLTRTNEPCSWHIQHSKCNRAVFKDVLQLHNFCFHQALTVAYRTENYASVDTKSTF